MNVRTRGRSAEGTMTKRYESMKVRRDKERDGGTEGRRDGGTEGRRDGGTKGRRDERDAGTQGRRDAGTKGRRDEGTEGRRDEGTKREGRLTEKVFAKFESKRHRLLVGEQIRHGW